MNNLGRAQENFQRAVYVLATGPGDINERLGDAFRRLSSISDESDVPEGALRDEFHKLMKRMTRETSVQATAGVMSTDNAVKVAKRVWALAYQIRGQWDDEVGQIGKRKAGKRKTSKRKPR